MYISIVSAVIAAISLSINLLTLKFRRDLEKSAEIARLHEIWWSDEMKKIREEAIEFVRDWEEADKKESPIIASYRTNEGYERERFLIGRIAYFFSDLNAFIDEGLASERFAYRLFAQSQFYYFSEFLLAASYVLEERVGTDSSSLPRRPRWISEIRELNQKFKRVEIRKNLNFLKSKSQK